mmetsp:Transcript_77351/g.206471  ORF Transcript_77351/g.206471 Transcript_77351/m.206471 type:complete len:292 (-) Transcript_77351:98-973(-)
MTDDDFTQFGKAMNLIKLRKHEHQDRGDIFSRSKHHAHVDVGLPGYDDFAHMHHHSRGGHNSANFLPFHRWFLIYLEQQLQVAAANCSLTIPYWNWAMDTNRLDKSDVWTDRRYGTLSEGCVSTGFAAGWHWTSMKGNTSCLRRAPTAEINGVLPSWKEVTSELHSHSSFTALHELVENTWHNPLHCLIGGQMCSMDSPVDPSFYLHHAFIDRMWFWWQRKLSHMEADCAGCTNFEVHETDFDTDGEVPAEVWASHFDHSRGCYPVPKNHPRYCLRYLSEVELPRIADAAA